MGSSTSRAIRRRRPATRTGWRPRCGFQAIDSLPSVQPKTNTSVFAGPSGKVMHRNSMNRHGGRRIGADPGRPCGIPSGPAPCDHAPPRGRHLRQFAPRIGHLRHPGTCGSDRGPRLHRLVGVVVARELSVRLHLREALREATGIRGIYAFARDGIGLRAGAATAWLFLAWAVLGAPAATVAAASYLAFGFH